jgi:Arc/MetJ family transcription regulator
MARYQSSDVYLTGRSAVTKTLLDLDEDLLAEAAAALGTRTKKDTVTVALQKVSEDARARRARALEDLLAVADADGFDYSRLDDLDQ